MHVSIIWGCATPILSEHTGAGPDNSRSFCLRLDDHLITFSGNARTFYRIFLAFLHSLLPPNVLPRISLLTMTLRAAATHSVSGKDDTFYATFRGSHSRERRNIFLTHVLGLLSAMIGGTWLLTCACMTNRHVAQLVLTTDPDTLWKFLAGMGLVNMLLLWSIQGNLETGKLSELRALGGLALFTALESAMLAPWCVFLAQIGWGHLVVQAFGATLFLFTGLTMYAARAKQDVTRFRATAVLALQGLLLWSIWSWWTRNPEPVAMTVAAICLFSFFVMLHVQEACCQLPPTKANAVLATLRLYLDFINLFIKVLKVLVENKFKEQRNNSARRK